MFREMKLIEGKRPGKQKRFHQLLRKIPLNERFLWEDGQGPSSVLASRPLTSVLTSLVGFNLTLKPSAPSSSRVPPQEAWQPLVGAGADEASSPGDGPNRPALQSDRGSSRG